MKSLILTTAVLLPLLLQAVAAQSSGVRQRADAVQDTGTPQPAAAAEQAIELSLAGGYAQYIAPYEAPFTIDRAGEGVSFRLTWRPEHRLRMGLESGWTRMYSYSLRQVETSFGVTDAELALSAIPLLIVFSMPVAGSFELHAGTGGYFVRSHATSFGSTTDVYAFSQGWMAAASWEALSVSAFRFGTRLTWYGATEFGDAVLLFQLSAALDLLRW